MLKTMIDEEQLSIANMSIEEISSKEIEYDKLTIFIKFEKRNLQLQYRDKREMLKDLQLINNLFQIKINQLNSIFTDQDKNVYKQDITKKHKFMSYLAIPILYFVIAFAMMTAFSNGLSALLFSLLPMGFFYILEHHDYREKTLFLDDLLAKVKECNEKYQKEKKPLLEFIKSNITRLKGEITDTTLSSKLKETFPFENLEEEKEKQFVKRL